MKLDVLRRVTRWCARVAALGLLVSSVRFGWVATHWAGERYEAARPDAAVGRERRPRSGPVERETTPPSPSASATASSAPEANASSRDDVASYEVRTLFVDLGPPRSDVFVSGVQVGQTPYAGTWSCKKGDEVVIHVLPRGRGVPLESRAACRDSMRAVAGRTLAPEDVAELLADPTLPASVKDAFRR